MIFVTALSVFIINLLSCQFVTQKRYGFEKLDGWLIKKINDIRAAARRYMYAMTYDWHV